MSNIRNKLAKIERAKREHEVMEDFLGTFGQPKTAPTPPPAQPRCNCGLTFYETTVWAIQYDQRRPPIYCCPACLPDWAAYDMENRERQDRMCNLYSTT